MSANLKGRIPNPIRKQLRMLKHRAGLCTRFFFEKLGLLIARKADYYSPLPSETALRKTFSRWAKPSELKGISYDLEAMRRFLKKLRDSYYDEFSALPPYRALCQSGFGPGYTHVDAFTLYAMLRELKPAHYIEVGSGLSTYYCHLARKKNREQGHETQITCIEPYPFTKLNEIEGIQLIQAEVQAVPVKTFESLGGGDVLFIDSSHVIRLDGDVPYLFLEVLPAIARGVHVHIHDIPFPYNIPYPPEYWTLLRHPGSPHWPKYWNEAMLLQAFLAFNPSFEITLSCPLIRHFDEEFMRATLPMYQPVTEEPNTFSSIWLRRTQ
jgi:hypothetical protein